jgi:hypothetical protein
MSPFQPQLIVTSVACQEPSALVGDNTPIVKWPLQQTSCTSAADVRYVLLACNIKHAILPPLQHHLCPYHWYGNWQLPNLAHAPVTSSPHHLPTQPAPVTHRPRPFPPPQIA